jgi:D-alanyl-D-alanine carboxypeptidase/D-alanyl-D-alanine-endopeptidase (penicillin-binding protein 4)
LAATAAGGSVPGSLGLSAAEMSVWAAAAYGMTGADFVDHSGLSDQSRISPQALVTGLVEARRSSLLDPLLKPLAVRDADGRVDRREGLRGAAKTGTLNFVSGLGGYLTTQDGRILAFAIFTADPETRARLTRAQRDRAPGARSWNGRSRRLQHAMLRRWGRIYAS